jgi:sulfur-oxidizing protein SoxZ
MSIARVHWREKVRSGEVFKVRLLIQHPMETGYLQDLTGKVVPRNIIQLLTCHLGNQEVFRIEPSSGISANPFFEFFLRATMTAEFKVQWVDDKGVKGQHLQILNVV